MISIPETYRGLPKSVYILFVANVINSLGNFVWPFLAIFLTDKLGMSKTDAGFIVTVSALMFGPGSLLGGKLADLVGRRRVFIISRTLAAMVLLPCAFLGSSPVIPILLVVVSFLFGTTDPAISAMVTDLTNAKNRQQAFSLLYLGHNIGFAVGPMVAGLLYENFLPWIFLGDALTTLVSIALVARYVPETMLQGAAVKNDESEDLPRAERGEDGGLVAALLKRPAIIVVSLVLMVYSFVYSQSYFSLPIQIGEVFGDGGPKLFGLLMSVNAVTVVLFTTGVTRLSAKYKPVQIVAVGGFCYAVGLGMVSLLTNMALFVLSTVIWTLGEIMIVINSAAYVANNSPHTHRARFNAFFNTVGHSGAAVGPVVMGRFIDARGVGMVWSYCFMLAAGASVLILATQEVMKLRSRKKMVALS